MSQGNIARNFLALASGDALARVFAFSASVYVARTLGPEMYGVIGFAMAVLLYFAQLADCGLDMSGVRDWAKDPEGMRDAAPAIQTARWIVGCALASLLAVGSWIGLPQPEAMVLGIYGLTLIPIGPGPKWIHLGEGRPRAVALGRTLGEITFLGLVLLLLREPAHITVVPFAQFTGDALGVTVMLYALKRRGLPIPIRFDWSRVRPVFERSWPLVVNVLLGLTIYNSDLIFLRIFRGRESVGHYSAAYQLISFLQNLATAYSLSLLPQLTRVLLDRVERDRVYQSSAAQLFAVGLPVGLGGCLAARALIGVVFGSEFEPSGGVLAILVLSVPFTLWKEVDLIALVATGRQATVMRMTGLAVIVNVVLNLALIPKYGLQGAAVATLSTEAARAVFATYCARREGFPTLPVRRMARPLLAGAMMIGTVLAFGGDSLPRIVALGAVAYAGTLAVLGGIQFRAGRPPTLRV